MPLADGNDQKSHPARPHIAWLILKGETIVDARSVLPVREHDKIGRTPLVAFFNISSMWRRACLLD
jgi:hypothetical protein